MKINHMVIVVIILMLSVQTASAEFYRYVDKHGNVLYTDDLSKVPADQREKARSYDESKSVPVVKKPAAEKKSSQEYDDVEGARKALEAEKKRIDQEYEALKKERDALQELKKAAVTPSLIQQYNEKIVEFNARAESLQKKSEEHAEKVKSFNEYARSQSPEAQNQ